MNHTTGCFHPLGGTRFEIAFVAHAVAMQHVAVQHVGQGDKTAVGVIGKAGDVFIRVVAAEVVEHQKRIEVTQGRGTDGAMHCNTGAFTDRAGSDDLGNVTYGHKQSPSSAEENGWRYAMRLYDLPVVHI